MIKNQGGYFIQSKISDKLDAANDNKHRSIVLSRTQLVLRICNQNKEFISEYYSNSITIRRTMLLGSSMWTEIGLIFFVYAQSSNAMYH